MEVASGAAIGQRIALAEGLGGGERELGEVGSIQRSRAADEGVGRGNAAGRSAELVDVDHRRAGGGDGCGAAYAERVRGAGGIAEVEVEIVRGTTSSAYDVKRHRGY